MGVRSLRVGVLAMGAMVLSVLGTAAAGSPANSPRHPSAAEEANREVARADARDLLDRLQLPPGSTYSPTKPAGTSTVLDAPLRDPSDPFRSRSLVLRRVWWIVPGDQGTVLKWIQAHPPAFAKLTPEELTDVPVPVGRSRADVAEFTRGPVPGKLIRRSLRVLLANRSDGSTILRADAAVEWTIPHPPEARIPSAARVLDVTVTTTDQLNGKVKEREITIAKPGTVHRIAALINGLPILQPPGVPSFGIENKKITLTFRASRRGRPLAEAIQELPSPPLPVTFLRIHGRGQTTLMNGGAVLRSVMAMLSAHQAH